MKKVFVLVLSAAMLLALGACNKAEEKGAKQSGSSASSQQPPEDTKGTPEYALKQGLESVKSLDFTKVSNYFEGDDSDQNDTPDFNLEDLAKNAPTAEQQEILMLMVKGMDYKFLSSSITGDTATVKVELQNKNLSNIMNDIMLYVFEAQITSQENIEAEVEKLVYEKLRAVLSDSSGDKLTSAVDVRMKKVDGEWKAIVDMPLLNGMLGGILKPLEGVLSNLAGVEDLIKPAA